MDAKLELTPHGVFAYPMRMSMVESQSKINSSLAVTLLLNYYPGELAATDP